MKDFHGCLLGLALCGYSMAFAGQDAQPVLSPEEVAVLETKAGRDPAELIRLANRTEDQQARELLRKVLAILVEDKKLHGDEKLTAQFLNCLERKFARTPDHAAYVLDSQAKKNVARQVFFRHYREQWVYEAPVSVWVVVIAKKGEGRRLQSVRAEPQ